MHMLTHVHICLCRMHAATLLSRMHAATLLTHSSLAARWATGLAAAGRAQAPARGARLLPCADETCERRAERCSTNYVVPLKRWQAFSCRATLPERVLCDFSCPPLTRLARFHWADLLVRRAL